MTTSTLAVIRAVRIKTHFGTHEDLVEYGNGGVCVPSLGDPDTRRFSCFGLDDTTFVPVRRRLTDRFERRTVMVEEPLILCVLAKIRELPARKAAAGEFALVCYRTDDSGFLLRFFRVRTQFDSGRGRLLAPFQLCVRGTFRFLT